MSNQSEPTLALLGAKCPRCKKRSAEYLERKICPTCEAAEADSYGP